MDKSIEQRAEEKYGLRKGSLNDPTRNFNHIYHYEAFAYIEGYKACQQNLEVSERLYTKDEMKKAFESGHAVGVYLMDEKHEEQWNKFLESLPKANS